MIKKKINKDGLNLYLSLRYVPFGQTMFENIYKIPASSYLIFDLNSRDIKIQKYWDIKFQIQKSKNLYLATKELRRLLEESVKMRLISDVPLGAFLSGGIDSSTIVALMSKNMEEPVKTFSIGFEQGAPVDETDYARYVSEYYNTDHKELIIESTIYEVLPELVWHYDDLIADPAIVPVYFMSKMAKNKITVALTGDGADEIFAGYAHYYWMNEKNYLKLIPKSIPNYLMKFYNFIPSFRLQMLISTFNLSTNDEDRFYKAHLIMKDLEKKNLLPFEFKSVQNILMGVFN